MRHCGLCWVGLRSPPPLRPGSTDPRLRASAAPRENAHRVPGGAPLLPAAPPRTGRRRSRRHLIPAAPPPHWPSGPPRGPAPPGLPVAIGRRRYRLATIGRFERTTADPRGGKRTHPPCARGTLGVVGGASYRPQQGLSQPRTSPSSALGCSARRCRPGAPLRSRRGAAGCSEESKASPQCPVLGFSAGNCTVSVAGVCGRQDLASALTLPHR